MIEFAPWRATSGMAPASSASSCSLAPTPHAVPPPQSSLWRAVPPPLIQPPPPRLSYQQRCRSQISLGIRGGCCSGCRIGCRCVRFPRRPRRDLSRRIERRRHLARRCSAAPARRVWCGVSVGAEAGAVPGAGSRRQSSTSSAVASDIRARHAPRRRAAQRARTRLARAPWWPATAPETKSGAVAGAGA